MEELFPFFAAAANLELITPPWLRFQILTPPPIEMRVGALIDYRLRWHGIPMHWRTRIEAWAPPFRFVDRQLRGPYRLWVHEHRFRSVNGGTLMVDHVAYNVPGGRPVQRLLVGREVDQIFAYRRAGLLRMFGAKQQPPLSRAS